MMMITAMATEMATERSHQPPYRIGHNQWQCMMVIRNHIEVALKDFAHKEVANK